MGKKTLLGLAALTAIALLSMGQAKVGRSLSSQTSLRFNATIFANIGAPANGTFLYCSDCTIANPCAGAGTGAFAKRLNGVWVCN